MPNRLMGLLADGLQGASNAAASNVSMPVDALAWALRKAGVPVGDAPIGGSDWMAQKGLTRQPENRMAGLLGESIGGVAPLLAAAKAPQIAAGLLQMGENLAAPATMNPQMGAIVYHGSPHKFDKFDSSKIGTGEGAQAYGHGLYLAESPGVAQGYRNPAGNTAYTIDGKNAIDAAYADRTLNKPLRYLQDFKGDVKAATQSAIDDGRPEIAQQIQELAASGRMKPAPEGSLYKVDLPDEAIAKMLDWDKPLSQQAPEVQQALEALGVSKVDERLNPANWKLSFDERLGGYGAERPLGGLVPLNTADKEIADQKLQELALRDYQNSGLNAVDQLSSRLGSEKATAETLRKAGIPGIRYLDGSSRGAGAGTSNFVVFPGNEGLLSILERNGKPIK